MNQNTQLQQNNTIPQQNSSVALMKEIDQCKRKYAAARSSILCVAAFTAINIILAVFNADIYMLFSAIIPYVISVTGAVWHEETGQILYLVLGAGVGLLITVPYLLAWIFSKKKAIWITFALIYYSLDCLFYVFVFDISFIYSILFHVFVLVELIIGIVYGAKLKKCKAALAAFPPMPAEQDVNGSAVPQEPASPAFSAATSSVEPTQSDSDQQSDRP